MRVYFIFEIKKGRSKVQPWYWRCKAANGEIRCHSENYASKAGAINGASSFMKKMVPGVARLDQSWRESIGPKRKTV